MRVSEASRCFLDYHRMNSKTNTVRNYELVFTRFCNQFGDRELESLTNEEILTFLIQFTEGTKQQNQQGRLYRRKEIHYHLVKVGPSIQFAVGARLHLDISVCN